MLIQLLVELQLLAALKSKHDVGSEVVRPRVVQKLVHTRNQQLSAFEAQDSMSCGANQAQLVTIYVALDKALVRLLLVLRDGLSCAQVVENSAAIELLIVTQLVVLLSKLEPAKPVHFGTHQNEGDVAFLQEQLVVILHQ